MSAVAHKAPTCALCANPLTKVPFQRLDFSYCSIVCLQQHKAQLDATAAAPDGGKVIAHNPHCR